MWNFPTRLSVLYIYIVSWHDLSLLSISHVIDPYWSVLIGHLICIDQLICIDPIGAIDPIDLPSPEDSEFLSNFDVVPKMIISL